MTILLDTTVLVDRLRGVEEAEAALARARSAGERLVCSVLTKVEILARVMPHEEARARRFLDQLDWIEVDDRIAERAGELARAFLRSHRSVELVAT